MCRVYFLPSVVSPVPVTVFGGGFLADPCVAQHVQRDGGGPGRAGWVPPALHHRCCHAVIWPLTSVSSVPVYDRYFSFLEEGGRTTHNLPPKALPLPPAATLPFTLKAITGWSKWSRFAISFQSTYLIKVNELLI